MAESAADAFARLQKRKMMKQSAQAASRPPAIVASTTPPPQPVVPFAQVSSAPATCGNDRLAQYLVGQLLGSGAFASVRCAVDRQTGHTYALKQVSKSCPVPNAMKTVANEVKLLAAIGRHRHTVSLIENFETPTSHVIVLELASGGEVFERLASQGAFAESAAATVIRHVAGALEHLHRHHVVHADLKPENLLYVSAEADSEVKLADFGCSAFCGGLDHPAYVCGARGTLSYIAPEELHTRRFDQAVDMWALGVVLFALLGGYLPFDPTHATPQHSVKERILRGVPAYTAELGGMPQRWEHVSAEARRLLDHLLDVRPSSRMTAAELVREPWVLHAAPSAMLPESDHALRHFNDSCRIWRMAADAVVLFAHAPHTARALSPKRHTQRLGASFAMAPATDQEPLDQELSAPTRFTHLPPSARRELQQAFQMLDEGGAGVIAPSMLLRAMHSIGASEADAEATLANLDADHDGVVSFDDFVRASLPLYEARADSLRRAFDVFDSDGSGALPATRAPTACVLCASPLRASICPA